MNKSSKTEQIKSLLQEGILTQKQIAKRLNVSESYISQLKRRWWGTTPTPPKPAAVPLAATTECHRLLREALEIVERMLASRTDNTRSLKNYAYQLRKILRRLQELL